MQLISPVSPRTTPGLAAADCSCPVWVWDAINFLGRHTSISPLAIAFHIRFWKVSWGGTSVRGYRKLVPASDCAREERELVCLHAVLGDNVGLLVLASEGSCGLTDVVSYIDRYVVIFNLVEHGESGNTESLLKCWPTQYLSLISVILAYLS